MDRYTSKKCQAIEEAIDALGIPSHVEINEGLLGITFLGTRLVAQDKSRGGTTISVVIPDWALKDLG